MNIESIGLVAACVLPLGWTIASGDGQERVAPNPKVEALRDDLATLRAKVEAVRAARADAEPSVAPAVQSTTPESSEPLAKLALAKAELEEELAAAREMASAASRSRDDAEVARRLSEAEARVAEASRSRERIEREARSRIEEAMRRAERAQRRTEGAERRADEARLRMLVAREVADDESTEIGEIIARALEDAGLGDSGHVVEFEIHSEGEGESSPRVVHRRRPGRGSKQERQIHVEVETLDGLEGLEILEELEGLDELEILEQLEGLELIERLGGDVDFEVEIHTDHGDGSTPFVIHRGHTARDPHRNREHRVEVEAFEGLGELEFLRELEVLEELEELDLLERIGDDIDVEVFVGRRGETLHGPLTTFFSEGADVWVDEDGTGFQFFVHDDGHDHSHDEHPHDDHDFEGHDFERHDSEIHDLLDEVRHHDVRVVEGPGGHQYWISDGEAGGELHYEFDVEHHGFGRGHAPRVELFGGFHPGQAIVVAPHGEHSFQGAVPHGTGSPHENGPHIAELLEEMQSEIRALRKEMTRLRKALKVD